MNKNINLIKKSEGDNYFLRNNKEIFVNDHCLDSLKKINIRPKKVLEIGCSNGRSLNNYKNYLKRKKIKCECYGIDLSKKAIKDGRKKYNNLKFFNYSSLQLEKFNFKFDLIICGFFLYLLDRQYIFEQFDKITKLLNDNGFLIINDFEPIFPHFNRSVHNKSLNSYKMNYSKFLEASNYYKLIYKHKWETRNLSDKKFLSNDISVNLFKKVAFEKSFPRNI